MEWKFVLWDKNSMETKRTQQNIAKDFDRWNGKKKMLDAAGINGPHCHEREIWWCSIGVNVGSEQHSQTSDFSRPVVVVRRFTEDIFWGVPLTTKTMKLPFRVRLELGGIANDALILQMRVYDRKRLVRQIGVVPQDVFTTLTDAIIDSVKTTDPARAGSSGAEANVYKIGYTNHSKKSISTREAVDKTKQAQSL